MANISQKSVHGSLDQQLGTKTWPGKVNRDPDRIYESGRKKYFIEAIAFSDKSSGGQSKRGKNQSDYWKAFSPAVSRLNAESQWGQLTDVVILMRMRYLQGWVDRTNCLGKSVWQRIGKLFPNLQVWLVSKSDLLTFTWNESLSASVK
jgi:hypothetical protein